MKQRLTLDEKKELVEKVKELSKSEKIGIKEACNRLNTPFWKYYGALKSIKKGNKKAKAEAKAVAVSPASGELKVEMTLKGEAARIVREYADAYNVEPEVVCKILLIDALKEKKKPVLE